MEEMLHEFAHYVAISIETIAILVIIYAVLEAIAGLFRTGIDTTESTNPQRRVWMRFARWLVAALTLQLAADLVNTSFDPTWDQVGHLAAVAGIRTFLSFFLEREMSEKRELIEKRERTEKS